MKKLLKIILLCIIMILLIKSITIKTTNLSQSLKTRDSIQKIELGKIKIPSISVNNKIVSGTSLKILDQNYVGHIKESSLDFNKTIILAGHNNKHVFKNLKALKKSDKIYLTIYDETKKYCVTSNLEIDAFDYTYFKNTTNTLILITCTKTSEKRRIIISKLCM